MFTINTTFAVIIAILCFVLIPTILILAIKNKKTLFIVACVFAALFFAALCICVLSSVAITKDVVTIKFVSNGQWCAKNINFSFSNLTKTDVIINLLMLFPLGAFSTVIALRKDLKFPLVYAFLIGLSVGLTIETLQFILPVNRSVQLSDIIFNGISVLIGGIWFRIVSLFRKKLYKDERQKNLNNL